MYNIKFVQKLAFAYRSCPLSLETTKHFQAYILAYVLVKDKVTKWVTLSCIRYFLDAKQL